jgi:hypothetical protein
MVELLGRISFLIQLDLERVNILFVQKYDHNLNRFSALVGFYYTSLFEVTELPDGTLAWQVTGLFLFEDETVLNDLHLYDYVTGVDLVEEPELINCQLHQGGPQGEGSVYFFRYP